MAGSEPEGDDGAREVCLCFHVTLRMLVRHARNRQIRFASQFAECNGAGTGCGWCRPQLESVASQLAADPSRMPRLAWDAEGYARERARSHAERGLTSPGERLADELEP